MMTLQDAQDDAAHGAASESAITPAIGAPANLPIGAELRQIVRDTIEDRGISQSVLGKEIGYSGGTISQWLNDKYAGDVAGLEAELQKWLAGNAEANALGAHAGALDRFFETPSAKSYMATLRYAHTMGTFGVLYGGSGTGKTSAALEYAAQRTGVRYLAASPAERTLVPFLRCVARACGVAKPAGGAAEITDSIVAKIERTKGLILVDEADHVDVTPIEQLRSIHDKTGVGIVLLGNDTVYSQITGGARATELARIFSRVGKRQRAVCLPTDIDTIAKGCGIAGRDELVFLRQIGAKPGHLRNVKQVIRQAAIRAAGKKEALSREHLEAAWANLGAES